MTKQQILELTGLSEDQFYDQYPDQESFCQDYPDACAQLQQAQEGINVVEQVSPSLRNQIGVNTQGDVGVLAYTPQVQPMVRDEYGTLRRPRTHDRMGRPIGPMVQTFDKIPVVNQPGGYINPEFEGYASNEPATGWQTNTGMWNRPGASVNAPYIDRSKTLQPLKVLAPIVNNYNLPKELVKGNLQTVPLKDFGSMQTLQKAMTPMQTMYNVGSIGAPSSVKLNKFSSVVDLLKSKGKDSSFAERKKLAEEVGIKNYTGSAAQNTQLMDYVSKMKQGGIYINPANKGKFTESANRAGMGVQEFARHVLANKEDYSTTQIRRANFARNAAKWKHQDGGMIEYRQGGQPCYECGGMYEKGGTAIFPAMRTMFKQGGYYGMDGRFHKNTDSGTYVMDGGYYFQAGGAPVTPSTPPTTGAPVDIPANQGWSPAGDGGFNIDTNFQYGVEDENQTDPALGGGMYSRQSRRRRSSDLYETPDLGGLSDEYQTDEQPMDEQPVYDASQYSSAVDPSTGFTTWSKNNKQLTNIKKQDPALWAQLKEEGRGARFRTGQTDIQKFGRAAGKIANTMQAGVELAGAIGNVLNERNRRRNMDAAAMNMGSTAAMFTNPQSAGKGDYGVTGSSYGAFKPYSTGTLSYKGMYGRYGMQVPKYAVGGYTPDIATLSDYGLEGKPEVPEVEFRDFSNLLAPFIPPAPLIVSPTDNTGVATQRINSTRNDIPSGIIDVDLALQAVAGIESSSKPGETKVGMRTKLVGKTGKKATASGTYQITEPTLKDIYNNNSNFNKTFKNFNEFKLAFDSNPEVEYAAAKSLMSNHIKNYGIYALGAWYQPSFAKRAMKGDKSVYDIIPSKDEYGNKKTWGQDFKEKLNAYNKIAGTSYNINSSISTKLPSVNIKNLHPNLMQFANAIFQTFPGLVLTSGNDSKHMKGSKHYNNKAIDIGANSSNKKDYLNLKNYLKNNPSIKKQYGIEDIIDEGDHLHIELMKKGGQLGGQVVEMDENEIQQFLKAGGQLEFID